MLNNLTVLLLTYRRAKASQTGIPRYPQGLDSFGGALLYVDDGKDSYNHVREWWNIQGTNETTPRDDLFARLNLDDSAATPGATRIGVGPRA